MRLGSTVPGGPAVLPLFLGPHYKLEGFAMTNAFTLDDLNAAIESKYAPFYFHAGDERFVLRQVLRLSATERSLVTGVLKELDSIGEDNVDEAQVLRNMERVLSIVTDNAKGPHLVDLLGHDLIRVQMLLEKWIEVTSAGEASPSPA